MKIGRRIIAAAAVATAGIAVPMTMAATSSPAHAAGDLCAHLYLQIGPPPPILNTAIVVLPALAIYNGTCPA